MNLGYIWTTVEAEIYAPIGRPFYIECKPGYLKKLLPEAFVSVLWKHNGEVYVEQLVEGHMASKIWVPMDDMAAQGQWVSEVRFPATGGGVPIAKYILNT